MEPFQTGLLVFGALEAVAVADFNRDGTLDIAGGMSYGRHRTFLNFDCPATTVDRCSRDHISAGDARSQLVRFRIRSRLDEPSSESYDHGPGFSSP